MSTSEKISSTIKTTLVPKPSRKRPPSATDEVPFGKVATDHMMICDFDPQKGGWQTPEIVPYQNFSMSPHALIFHYAQEIFEGMKAYRNPKNAEQIYLFRPDRNAQRFEDSAKRMAMTPVPLDLFEACVTELVKVERDWIMPTPSSLYIRPSLIALDDAITVKPSQRYRFFIIVSPVKSYFTGAKGVTVAVERTMVRAAPGGVGTAKCGGNYAASLLASAQAQKAGADQVLWTDAHEHKYVEEVGAMNVMFVYQDEIITPALSGSILPGITRASLLQLAPHLGYKIRETRVKIDDVIADAKSGKLKEMFGCGTAAVISPVTGLLDNGERVTIGNGDPGEISLRLKQALQDIQTGVADDPFGWRREI